MKVEMEKPNCKRCLGEHFLRILWTASGFREKLGMNTEILQKCFKKVPRQSQSTNYSRVRRLAQSSLACALFRQEAVVPAAIESLFEILAEKSGLGSTWVYKNDWIAESLQNTQRIAENR